MAPIDAISVLRAWLNPFKHIAVWLRMIKYVSDEKGVHVILCPIWMLIFLIIVCWTLS